MRSGRKTSWPCKHYRKGYNKEATLFPFIGSFFTLATLYTATWSLLHFRSIVAQSLLYSIVFWAWYLLIMTWLRFFFHFFHSLFPFSCLAFYFFWLAYVCWGSSFSHSHISLHADGDCFTLMIPTAAQITPTNITGFPPRMYHLGIGNVWGRLFMELHLQTWKFPKAFWRELK